MLLSSVWKRLHSAFASPKDPSPDVQKAVDELHDAIAHALATLEQSDMERLKHARRRRNGPLH